MFGILALAAIGYLLLKKKAVFMPVSGKTKTWLARVVRSVPTAAGLDQIIEIWSQDGKTRLAAFRQFGNFGGYRLLLGTSPNSPEAKDMVSEFGLTVLSGPALNSQTQTWNGTNYRVDLVGYAPNGYAIMDVYLAGGKKLFRAWQKPNDSNTRIMIESDLKSGDPQLLKGMADFKLPPAATGLT